MSLYVCVYVCEFVICVSLYKYLSTYILCNCAFLTMRVYRRERGFMCVCVLGISFRSYWIQSLEQYCPILKVLVAKQEILELSNHPLSIHTDRP